VCLEDILRRKLVLVSVINEVLKRFFSSLLLLGGFHCRNARCGIGEERSVLASPRNSAVRVSKAVVINVGAGEVMLAMAMKELED
jgi:hypothetical protein